MTFLSVLSPVAAFPFQKFIPWKFLTNSLLSVRHTLNHFGPRRILKSLTFLLTFCILIRWRRTIFFPVRLYIFCWSEVHSQKDCNNNKSKQAAGNLFDGTSWHACISWCVGVRWMWVQGWVSVGQHSGVRVCHRSYLYVWVGAFWPGDFCRFWLRQKCRKFVQVTCLITFFQTFFFLSILLCSILAIDGFDKVKVRIVWLSHVHTHTHTRTPPNTNDFPRQFDGVSINV